MRRFDHCDMYVVLRELQFFLFNPTGWEESYGSEDDYIRFIGLLAYVEYLGFGFDPPVDDYDFYESWEITTSFLMEFYNPLLGEPHS